MALLEWNDNLSVSIQEIDLQHQKLVGMLNELHQAMMDRKGKEILGVILDRLVDYTKEHFSYEESLFKKHAYPEYDLHKKEHDNLTGQVFDLQKRYQEGAVALSVELCSFLKDWLIHHIQGTDMRYGPFLKSKGVS